MCKKKKWKLASRKKMQLDVTGDGIDRFAQELVIIILNYISLSVLYAYHKQSIWPVW